MYSVKKIPILILFKYGKWKGIPLNILYDLYFFDPAFDLIQLNGRNVHL